LVFPSSFYIAAPVRMKL